MNDSSSNQSTNGSTNQSNNESNTNNEVFPIRITMLADWICAWCYIGHVIAHSAVEQLSDDSVFVHWRVAPFFLDGTLPDTPVPTETYYANKFKSFGENVWETKKRAVLLAGARHGLHFDFTGSIGSTMRAHRLVLMIDLYDQATYQTIYRTLNHAIHQIHQNHPTMSIEYFHQITPKIPRNIFLLPLMTSLYSAFTEKRTPLSEIESLLECVQQVNLKVCGHAFQHEESHSQIDVEALVKQSTDPKWLLDQFITQSIKQSIKPINPELIREFLLSKDLTSNVQMGVINAYRAGITSIPYFKIDKIVDPSLESIIQLAVEQAKQPNIQSPPIDQSSESKIRTQLLNQPLNQPINSTINLSVKSQYEVVGGEKTTIFDEIFEKMGAPFNPSITRTGRQSSAGTPTIGAQGALS